MQFHINFSEMVPMEGYKFGCEGLILLPWPLSEHICLELALEYLSFVSTCRHHIATPNSTHFGFISFCHHSLHICTIPLTPDIHWSIINVFHENIVKNVENQPLSICQVSYAKANRQLSIYLLYQVNEANNQTKLTFFVQNSISQTLASANQAGFVRQSHIMLYIFDHDY